MVRTWDLPTGYMVNIFIRDSVATSLKFSPTGDYLATAHVDNVGILWEPHAIHDRVVTELFRVRFEPSGIAYIDRKTMSMTQTVQSCASHIWEHKSRLVTSRRVPSRVCSHSPTLAEMGQQPQATACQGA
ncbi:hypothetical protein B0O80DRAFT_109354 [Mortierella sp. GBAus27b]|nr:hypothetical protein B0O80DRAFT_109354 [Mortierella sp. GBAus27b]